MKLTKQAKEYAAEQAANKVYGKKLEKAYAALVQPVMDAKIAAGDRLASEIPAGWEKWIDTHSSKTVYICLDQVLRDVGRERRYVEVKFPVSFVGNYDRHDFGSIREPWNHPTVEKIRNLEKAKQDFYFDCLAVCNSCTTDNQLKEVSPELFAFIPTAQSNSCQLVPVETIAKVRDELERQDSE